MQTFIYVIFNKTMQVLFTFYNEIYEKTKGMKYLPNDKDCKNHKTF